MEQLLTLINNDLSYFTKVTNSLGDSALGVFSNPLDNKNYYVKMSKKEKRAKVSSRCGEEQNQEVKNDILTEYLISKIGVKLKTINVCEYFVGKDNGNIRIYSKSFLDDYDSLFHGMELFADAYKTDELEDPRHKKIPSIYILYNIKKYLYAFLKSQQIDRTDTKRIYFEFLCMCLWDALIGNNDRHLQNWGLIIPDDQKKKISFSPIFDTARSFMWNILDSKIKLNKVAGYCMKGTPHIGFFYGKKCNHFELISNIVDTNLKIISDY